MTDRAEWAALNLYDAAMTLRMARDGSADPIPAEDAREIREVLERRIGPEWRPSLWPARTRSDEALRAFVQAVLDETADPSKRPTGCSCGPGEDCEACKFP